jgi:pimeloyl-ACP methyl ester carboxylesterase
MPPPHARLRSEPLSASGSAGVIRREEIAVEGGPAQVWTGGEGDPLLLLHGGWGGAEMHWAPVWETLATACRVIAPDIPGIGAEAAWVPHSLDEAAAWVERVLDATGTPAAWITGNSFGAAVASRVVSRSPERCLGLVLVGGGPAPAVPAFLRSLLRRRRLRRALEGMVRKSSFSPSTLDRAFADPRRAPAALRELVTGGQPRPLAILTEIFLADDPPVGPPRARTLIIWGAEDRLPGSKAARLRLPRALNARLVVVPDAGHLPQVEQPARFADAVLEFIRAGAPGP